MSGARVERQVAGRALSLSNLDKVLWPETGFTKGGLISYYQEVAAMMLPHLSARPVTLRRWPDGVTGHTFFQKHAPGHRPEWVPTVELGGVHYLRIEEPAALAWAANLAAIEIHPGLARAPGLDRPDFVVFDLDPGPPADVITCARVALILRGLLAPLGLRAWPKTSGSKGLQLYVPVRGASFADTRQFSLSLAHMVEAEYPDLVVTAIDPALRTGRVLIDWSQNAPSRTTVSVYSVRAREFPSVSTPVTWDEIEAAHSETAPGRLRFDTAAVLGRLERDGDIMAGVLQDGADLPTLRS